MLLDSVWRTAARWRCKGLPTFRYRGPLPDGSEKDCCFMEVHGTVARWRCRGICHIESSIKGQ